MMMAKNAKAAAMIDLTMDMLSCLEVSLQPNGRIDADEDQGPRDLTLPFG
jgi:hypothetical protein